VKWRRLFRVLHRDIGYLLFGLVLAYSISGVAVNHVDDWNPNYSVTTTEVDVGALPSALATGGLDAMEAHVAAALDLADADIRGRRRPSPDRFVVFLPEGGEVKLAVSSGRGTLKRVTTRPGLFQVNVLHLNHLKGVWTWVADAFAILLGFLAISGLVMLKGKTGLGGRGKWFVLAGLLVPAVFLWMYYAR
jgi:hypothetical protein